MMKHPVEVTLTTRDGELANQIIRLLEADGGPGSDSFLFSRRGIDGATATWVVSSLLASQNISLLLNFIVRRKALNSVTSIKVHSKPDGEAIYEVTNPRPEHVDLLLSRLRDGLPSPPGDLGGDTSDDSA